MPNLTTIISVAGASFAASCVEVVEAFTIILAVGLTRGWRPALDRHRGGAGGAGGDGAGVRPAARRWCRSGLLMSSSAPCWCCSACAGCARQFCGPPASSRCTTRPRCSPAETRYAERRHAADRRADGSLAGIAAFKAVLLEGVEVVFIVIAVGAGGAGMIGLCQPGRPAVACALVDRPLGSAGPPAARDSAGKHPEIRRRPDALGLRHLLDRRGAGRRLARRRRRQPRHSSSLFLAVALSLVALLRPRAAALA